jgi:membrane-bound metal-dependent hydrolase YbcI (DUF457 family)
MSGLGHLAVGLAAKPSTPEVPLWLLLAASETNDLLYFVFSSVGLEAKAGFTMDLVHGVSYVRQSINPWSHGLFMSILWSALAAVLAYIFYRSRRSAGIVALVVFSHWILDFLMHSNLPLFFEGGPLLGLGLENSGAGFIFMTLLDLSILGIGITMYTRSRIPKPIYTESKQ